MIHRALELDNVTVREVMVPHVPTFSRCQATAIIPKPWGGVSQQHSRVPVYDPQARSGAHHRRAVCQSLTGGPPPAHFRASPAGFPHPRVSTMNQPDHRMTSWLCLEPGPHRVAGRIEERKRHLRLWWWMNSAHRGCDHGGRCSGADRGRDRRRIASLRRSRPWLKGKSPSSLEGQSASASPSHSTSCCSRATPGSRPGRLHPGAAAEIPDGDSFDYDGHRYTVRRSKATASPRLKSKNWKPKWLSSQGD